MQSGLKKLLAVVMATSALMLAVQTEAAPAKKLIPKMSSWVFLVVNPKT